MNRLDSATTKLFFRYWKNKEFHLIALAVLLSVMCMTAVLLITQSLKLELEDKTGALLGGDRLLTSPISVDSVILEKARNLGLKTSQAINFLSVLVHKEDLSLADVQAVDANYPLRGALKIAGQLLAPDNITHAIPARGTVWLEPKLFSLLGLNIGDTVQIGAAVLTVTQVLTLEPARAFEGFSLAPRALMNEADVPATEIVQPGSRVTYRLFLAGENAILSQFDDWVASKISSGQKYVDTKSNRTTLKTVIEQIERYFGLIVTLNVGLASVALALAARQFSQKQQATVALLRCFGASFQWIFVRYLASLVLLGIVAGFIGNLFGFLIYRLVAHWFLFIFASINTQTLAILLMPIALGLTIGLILLLGFVLPFLINLQKATALMMLRKEIPALQIPGRALSFMAVTCLLLLLSLFIKDLELVFAVFLAIISISVGAVLILKILLQTLRKIAHTLQVSWRFGILNLARRSNENAIQLFAFSLVLMLFLVAFLVQTDLFRTWQNPLTKQAPNYFAINIPGNDLTAFQSFLKEETIGTTELYPIVRAQLVAVNDDPTSMDPKSSAKRIMERLLNVTWTSVLPSDNKILQGKWFATEEHPRMLVSIEAGFAERLSIKLGDVLTFKIGEKLLEATVASIRSVAWDSFRPNFFVIFPVGVLEEFPNTAMTSFYLPKQQLSLLRELVKKFPMVSLIDIETVLTEVKSLIGTMIHIIQILFAVTFLMALLLMNTTLASTLAERRQEKTLLRTLGASNQQLTLIALSEFLLLGLFSGLIAVVAANLFTAWLEIKILKIPYITHWDVVAWGPIIGMGIVGLGGWIGVSSKYKS